MQGLAPATELESMKGLDAVPVATATIAGELPKGMIIEAHNEVPDSVHGGEPLQRI